MHSTRDIHPFDTTGRGRPLMSAVCFPCTAFRKLRRGVAFAGGSAVRSPRAAGDSRFSRCHQAARGGTGGHARAAAQGGRTAAKTKGRYRGDWSGPLQAQPATDRHRHPGAHVETRIGETEAGLRPLDSREQAVRARSIHAAPKSSRCWRRCNAPAGARRRRCWSARRRAAIAAHRHAARIGRPRSCADARRNLPPISASS
jgi:hypothetical protein